MPALEATIAVRLPAAQAEQIRRIATADDRKIGAVARRLIQAQLTQITRAGTSSAAH